MRLDLDDPRLFLVFFLKYFFCFFQRIYQENSGSNRNASQGLGRGDLPPGLGRGYALHLVQPQVSTANGAHEQRLDRHTGARKLCPKDNDEAHGSHRGQPAGASATQKQGRARWPGHPGEPRDSWCVIVCNCAMFA